MRVLAEEVATEKLLVDRSRAWPGRAAVFEVEGPALLALLVMLIVLIVRAVK